MKARRQGQKRQPGERDSGPAHRDPRKERGRTALTLLSLVTLAPGGRPHPESEADRPVPAVVWMLPPRLPGRPPVPSRWHPPWVSFLGPRS